MSTSPGIGQSRTAHLVVLGNEKGGSGKSTIAMHVAVALMKAGQRVAIRSSWKFRRTIVSLAPTARPSKPMRRPSSIMAVEKNHDFIIIDTPGTDNYLMRLGHSMADTLITPPNDSVDFDVLASVDPTTFAVTGGSQYAKMVGVARRRRRLVDGALSDWVVVRNRLPSRSICTTCWPRHDAAEMPQPIA